MLRSTIQDDCHYINSNVTFALRKMTTMISCCNRMQDALSRDDKKEMSSRWFDEENACHRLTDFSVERVHETFSKQMRLFLSYKRKKKSHLYIMTHNCWSYGELVNNYRNDRAGEVKIVRPIMKSKYSRRNNSISRRRNIFGILRTQYSVFYCKNIS